MERLCEFIHQVHGSGVAVRLEKDMDAPGAAGARGCQRRQNFSWMMAVIVDDADAADFAFDLEAAAHACEFLKSLARDIGCDAEFERYRNRGSCVQDVV